MKRIFSIVVAAASVAVSFCAFAQSEEAALKHAATMEAIGKLADALKAQAEANARLSERVTGGQAVIAQPQREVQCEGFMNCTASGVKALFQAVTGVAQIGSQYVGPILAYRTATRQYDYQAVAAREATAQAQAQQNTLQYAFGAQRDTANNGFTAATAIALKPEPPAPVGQVWNVSGNGVNFGAGTLNYQSQNPINPNPRIVLCTPTYSTNGVATGQVCSDK